MKKIWIRKVPMVIALVTAGVFAFSGIVMFLWNHTLPVVLHAGAITFWQAMGILVLSKILFSGLSGRRGMAHRHWKKQMFGQWQDMTPEEKEMFAARRGCRKSFATE